MIAWSAWSDLSAPSLRQWMLLALTACVLLSMWYAARKRQPERRLAQRRRSEQDAANRQAQSIHEDMPQLLGELGALSQKLDEQLKGKHLELQQAIEEADQRISALRILISASRSSGASSQTAQDPPRSLAGAPLTDPRIQRIHELADQGLTATEIARKLEESGGEVELILNLRSAARRTPSARTL